jgi:sulfur-oxidizing protein SoxZ
MSLAQPRVQSPARVARGAVFEVKTLIQHPMETGLRHDAAGRPIPRALIHSFSCRYDGEDVFRADLHEGMAADPYLSFHVRAGESGQLEFRWEEDGGAVCVLTAPLEVTA